MTEPGCRLGRHSDETVVRKARTNVRRAVAVIVATAALSAGSASGVSDAAARSTDQCVRLEVTDPSVCDPA
jgi:hypothetical protein